MKNILTLFAFTVCLGIKAQAFQTLLTSQGWAGGICCRSGVNYNLAIIGKAAELEKLAVEALCIDGIYLKTVRSSEVITGAYQTSYRTFYFEYSTDHTGEFKEDLNKQVCSDTGRIYLKGNEFLIVESHKRLEFLAYP